MNTNAGRHIVLQIVAQPLQTVTQLLLTVYRKSQHYQHPIQRYHRWHPIMYH